MTAFHPTNEAFMASVIDNNVVMWDVSDGGVKTVCNAVLGGKGEIFKIFYLGYLTNLKNYYLNFKFILLYIR